MLSDKSAYFQDTHAKIGLLPGWGLSQRLPRVVGPSTAKEISLTARRVPATEAASLGFVTRVVPDDALASAAREVAEELGMPRRDVYQFALALGAKGE